MNLVSFYHSLFSAYAGLDFSKIAKEKINGNIYYYDKPTFEMTDEIIDRLFLFGRFDEPKFLEIIDGELVNS